MHAGVSDVYGWMTIFQPFPGPRDPETREEQEKDEATAARFHQPRRPSLDISTLHRSEMCRLQESEGLLRAGNRDIETVHVTSQVLFFCFFSFFFFVSFSTFIFLAIDVFSVFSAAPEAIYPAESCRRWLEMEIGWIIIAHPATSAIGGQARRIRLPQIGASVMVP